MAIEWKKFANASVLLLGLPYFAGYVYLDAYYMAFGVALSELDVSDQRVYVNAFPALFRSFTFKDWMYDARVWSGFVLICLVAVFLILTQVPSASTFRKSVTDQLPRALGSTSFFILSYASALVLLFHIANQSGKLRADENLDLLDEVTVTHDGSRNSDDPLRLSKQGIGDGKYLFLHATGETLFLIRPTKRPDHYFYLVRMPRSDTELSFVLRDYSFPKR